MHPDFQAATSAAKATYKQSLDKKKGKSSSASPPATRTEIKGFFKQHPTAASLFGEIVGKWRGSSSRRPANHGFWAAYPYPEWASFTGLSVATLKRHLDVLEEGGLIERERGRHAGTRVLTFIRPSPNGLHLSTTRPGDWTHLGTTHDEFLNPTPPPKPLAETGIVIAKKAAPQHQDEDAPKTKEHFYAIMNGLPWPPKTASD